MYLTIITILDPCLHAILHDRKLLLLDILTHLAAGVKDSEADSAAAAGTAASRRRIFGIFERPIGIQLGCSLMWKSSSTSQPPEIRPYCLT